MAVVFSQRENILESPNVRNYNGIYVDKQFNVGLLASNIGVKKLLCFGNIWSKHYDHEQRSISWRRKPSSSSSSAAASSSSSPPLKWRSRIPTSWLLTWLEIWDCTSFQLIILWRSARFPSVRLVYIWWQFMHWSESFCQSRGCRHLSKDGWVFSCSSWGALWT